MGQPHLKPEDEYEGLIIYGLHNGDERIRYVGKTLRGPMQRLLDHVKDARDGSQRPVHTWIMQQEEVFVKILDECETHEELDTREMELIKQHRAQGDADLNTRLYSTGLLRRRFEK